MADDAGALLVRSGLVSTSALEEARARMAELGGTIGEQLVATGAISDDALTDFYRSRLLVPQVNPNTLARLPIRVVAAIPADMAVELRAIPVSLDTDNNLTVAMSDPSDRHAVDEIAFFTGAYVVRAVATQMQIAWCLAHYYGHVTALGQRLLQGADATPSAPDAVPAATPTPRAKGLTGKVDALRHRAIAPVTGQINPQRPISGGGVVVPAMASSDSQGDTTPALGTVAPPAPVASPPGDDADTTPADGTPAQPRARSISGEIRVPGRRAQSIRPAPPPAYEDDESDPVISIEAGTIDEEPTGPRKVAPKRRAVEPDPPELAARAGEVAIAVGRERQVDDGPGIIVDQELYAPTTTVVISDDIVSGVIVQERVEPESTPILLDRRRPSDVPTAETQRAPTNGDGDGEDEVVVLDAVKAKAARPDKRTQIGIGVLPAATRTHRDTEASLPAMYDDPTGVDVPAAPPADEDTDETTAPIPTRAGTEDGVADPPSPAPRVSTLARAATPPVTPRPESSDGTDDDDDDKGPATAVMSAVELDEAIPQRTAEVVPAHLERKPIAHDPVDDGWGPPGTTIPPPLLGAIPGGDDEDGPSAGRIPVPDLDDAPLIVAPPAPPEVSRGAPADVGSVPARAVEDATSRLIELIRALEHAQDRDEVVGMMIDHLAESHRRAGFFVIKPTATKGVSELTVFRIEPRPAMIPYGSLTLDKPSTLQDVVGTRLPYRGPMHDDASRAFLTNVLGACPPEILLVPVAVRERVVGVLFGDHRMKHTFDDQLALAARAAGMSLERILKAKRG